MRRLLIAAALAAGFTTGAHADRPALEFKNYRPGEPASASSFTGSWRCGESKGRPDSTNCSTRNETIAGVTVDLVMVFIEDGAIKTVSVIFPSRSFTQVANAMQAKYGPPDATTRRELQNRMGAKFQDVKMRWFDGTPDTGGPYMDLQRFTSDVTQSSLYITILPKAGDLKQQQEQATKKNSEDL